MIDKAQTERVQTAMIAVARAHSIPIALITGERAGKHLGTGTIIQLRGKPYLLTCDHIVRERMNDSLAIGLGPGMSPIGVINPIQTGDSTNDVAVSRLEESWLVDGFVRPLVAGKLASKSVYNPDDLLFVFGFPGFLDAPRLAASFDGDTEKWTSTPMAITRPQTKLPPKYDPQLHFAIRYSSHDMLPITGGRGRATPHGLSGSIVWHTRADKYSDVSWTPEYARVIGIAIEWCETYAAIVCLRIEVIRRFLLRALVQEAAYFRWYGRGMSISDDQSDWYWAESMIHELE